MILEDQLVIILAQLVTMEMEEISIVEIKQEMATVIIGHLAIGVKLMVILVEIKRIEAEVEVGLTPAQMSEDLE